MNRYKSIKEKLFEASMNAVEHTLVKSKSQTIKKDSIDFAS